MKIKWFFIIVIYLVFLSLKTNSNTMNSQTRSKSKAKAKAKLMAKLKAHMSMMNKVKLVNINILNDLNLRANGVDNIAAKQNKKIHQFIRLADRSKISKIPSNRKILFESENENSNEQYFYYTYEEIVNKLLNLKDNALYKDLFLLETAQEKYKLPYPGGKCKIANKAETHCPHYIVTLTNKKISDKDKHQIYISGSVHGDERIGPSASIELILLLLENYKTSDWINHLLNTRIIVITPMTNPHGYYANIREEYLLEDATENSWTLTKDRYNLTHKDINRDFPYLVKNNECFETVGARVVNELFLDHLFSLSLSLHGGTESLTFPFGTPNHLVGNPIIEMNYSQKNNGEIDSDLSSRESLIDEYLNGNFDKTYSDNKRKRWISYPAPDLHSFYNIASSSNTDQYAMGDMSSIVYPVRGGMEDWAYSASWEGSPIITQPCKPNTYNGYSEEKTNYSNYKNSMKSVMFLLEISNEKYPEQKLLGRKNNDCILRLKDNAFFTKKLSNAEQKFCVDENINGYISKVIRLSLSLIDLLFPYVNSKYTISDDKEMVTIEWAVGGAIEVDETYVTYVYGGLDDVDISKDQLLRELSDDVEKGFKYKGKGIWNTNFELEKDKFSYSIPIKNSKKKHNYLYYQIESKVDRNWANRTSVNPNIGPVSHIVNFRLNDNYIASNGKYEIKGKSIISSKIMRVNIN